MVANASSEAVRVIEGPVVSELMMNAETAALVLHPASVSTPAASDTEISLPSLESQVKAKTVFAVVTAQPVPPLVV